MNIDTNIFRIGDQIRVGKYTATCQKVKNDSAIFLLDQYLDASMQMNSESTNEGGYAASNLRKKLNSNEILKKFDELKLKSFENGDLLRLPFYGEMFGHDDWYGSGTVEPDDCDQWPLMKERANRIAERNGESYEWGWLQNKRAKSTTVFCGVDDSGYSDTWSASSSVGVRPVFQLALSIIKKKEI